MPLILLPWTNRSIAGLVREGEPVFACAPEYRFEWFWAVRGRFRVFRIAAAVVLAAFLGGAAARAQAPPTFQHEILPLFEQKCLLCHGEAKQAGLDLRTLNSIMAGGSSGPALIAGKPDQSVLWKMVDSGKMPMGGEEFGTEQKQLIRYWIENGRFPSLESARDENQAAKITAEARNFWSFRKPVQPAVPELKNAARVRTPIDAFALRQLEDKGWGVNADADRATLIRRAYLDLTGLPPTPDEVQAFVEDPSPEAYGKLIDRLLASPQYGERWGRHWLDVAGYSDSVGNADDELRPVSWEYRDWVIRAFNEDRPYDQFLVEQIAGDQLVNYEPGTKPKPEHIDELTATGFLRLPPDITDTQTIYQVDKWYDALQTTVETSLKAVTGLTVGCARCHDHKFDPILQEDYYKLTAVYQAVWDPENWLPAAIGFGEWPTRYILDAEKEQREAWIESVTGGDGYRSLRRDRRRLEEAYAAHRNRWRDKATAEAAAGGAAAAVDLPEITDEQLEKLFPELAAQAESFRAKEKELKGLTPHRIWAAWDLSKNPSPTYLLIRGNYLSPGYKVEPGIPLVLDDPESPFRFPDAKPEWNHTGRRLTLAKWLTQPDHPLTARVIVNRVWQFHFGEGIVRTPDDFGTTGARPTHPELLDWLAVNFVQNGWSFKWLHRQIMQSTVYRQSSAEDHAKMAADPSNKLLWRKAPLRLEAESIRDSMLAVTGELDSRQFGKYEPLTRAEDGEWVVDTENGGNEMRRSVYILNRRSGFHGMLQTFDAPTMDNGNMPQRFRSALPTQSLVLMNSQFVVDRAEVFARRVMTERDNFDGRVSRAFELAYGRGPEEGERSLAHGYLETRPNDLEAWRTFCQAIFGSNQFLYSF